MNPVVTRMDRCESCGLVRLYLFDFRGSHTLRYDYGEAPGFVRKGQGRIPKEKDRAAMVGAFLSSTRTPPRERALLQCHGTTHEWRFGPLVRGYDAEWRLKAHARERTRLRRVVRRRGAA